MSCRLDSLQTRRVAAGHSVTRLAQLANVSDRTITVLEAKGSNGLDKGGTCDEDIAIRLANALAPPVALTSNTQASPTEFTAAAPHKLVTGDTVTIAGVAGADADPNGNRVVTVTSATKFTVAIDCSTAGGTGGTASLHLDSVGIARL